jgi:hypothetical protein
VTCRTVSADIASCHAVRGQSVDTRAGRSAAQVARHRSATSLPPRGNNRSAKRSFCAESTRRSFAPALPLPSSTVAVSTVTRRAHEPSLSTDAAQCLRRSRARNRERGVRHVEDAVGGADLRGIGRAIPRS